MRKCGKCGGRLRRVHRTLLERFSYMAIYECRDCRKEQFYPRRFRYHFGDACRCPKCGTFRVVRLKERDRIDPLSTGFLNFLERVVSRGKLFHCRYCRLQFFDRRELATGGHAEQAPDEAEDTAPRDSAKSDA